MRVLFWVIVAGFAALCVWLVWHVRRRIAERRRAEEARVAAFVSGLIPARPQPAAPAAAAPAAAAPTTGNEMSSQKLLFEAAHKAGEAGEPALAIQLYARLLARYPASPFAADARAAVEGQKKKLAKA
jgi:TolA-binding protein